MPGEVTVHSLLDSFILLQLLSITVSNTLVCSITNAVKTSGGLRERLFNAAYKAKKQALLNGKNIIDKRLF